MTPEAGSSKLRHNATSSPTVGTHKRTNVGNLAFTAHRGVSMCWVDVYNGRVCVKFPVSRSARAQRFSSLTVALSTLGRILSWQLTAIFISCSLFLSLSLSVSLYLSLSVSLTPTTGSRTSAGPSAMYEQQRKHESLTTSASDKPVSGARRVAYNRIDVIVPSISARDSFPLHRRKAGSAAEVARLACPVLTALRGEI